MATLDANFGLGHGVLDFFSSAVVHSMGSMIALAGAIIFGPGHRQILKRRHSACLLLRGLNAVILATLPFVIIVLRYLFTVSLFDIIM